MKFTSSFGLVESVRTCFLYFRAAVRLLNLPPKVGEAKQVPLRSNFRPAVVA
ncbi:MAG: hypothetical protein ACTS80_02165 [Candidatus Hodgkinia cicadicola]